MLQGTIGFNISVNDTGKTKHTKKVVGFRADRR